MPRSKRAPVLPLLGGGMLALLLMGGESATAAVEAGLKRCTATVIPVLFPFMVISAFLVESGAGEWLGRLFERPMRLFGLPGSGASALILGAVCGFPVGARTAAALYDRGELSRRELERLLCFASNAGVGFVVGAVGGLWSSRGFGVGLYAIQLGCALLIGLCLGKPGEPSRPHRTPANPPPLAACFTDAVTSSATALLAVCAYVIFFSALIGAAGRLLDRLSPSPLLDALLFAACELTSGVGMASMLASPVLGGTLCAFAVGWSGLGVHMQVMAVTAGRGLRYRRYLAAKLCHGLLCAAATAVWLGLSPPAGFAPCMAVGGWVSQPGWHEIGINLCFIGSAGWAMGAKLWGKFRERYGFSAQDVV